MNNMNKFQIQFFCLMTFIMLSCQSDNKTAEAETIIKSKSVRLVTLDPGHFHAALIQKNHV